MTNNEEELEEYGEEEEIRIAQDLCHSHSVNHLPVDTEEDLGSEYCVQRLVRLCMSSRLLTADLLVLPYRAYMSRQPVYHCALVWLACQRKSAELLLPTVMYIVT
jgi:hypothetical protein